MDAAENLFELAGHHVSAAVARPGNGPAAVRAVSDRFANRFPASELVGCDIRWVGAGHLSDCRIKILEILFGDYLKINFSNYIACCCSKR